MATHDHGGWLDVLPTRSEQDSPVVESLIQVSLIIAYYNGLIDWIDRHRFTKQLLVDHGDLLIMITLPVYCGSRLFQVVDHLNSLNRL